MTNKPKLVVPEAAAAASNDPDGAQSIAKPETKTEKMETVAARTTPDPFTDLSQIRLDQSFADSCGVKKLLSVIPVRKPLPQDFVRVHPDPTYRGNGG
jgi:hypothetical protein